MKTKVKIAIQTKRALSHMTPAHVVLSRINRQTIMKFAEKIGLVYFGYVDQRKDEHRLVRGHTVSSSHIDDHYCVGSFRGYDITLVARNDLVQLRESDDRRRCHWLIVTVDLHTKIDVPHLYIGHHTKNELFLASYERLQPFSKDIYAQQMDNFFNKYTIFGNHDRLTEITNIINPGIAQVIATHFKDASIEIEDNTIYLYIESQHPNEVLLESMLSNGLWLAETIDTLLNNSETD